MTLQVPLLSQRDTRWGSTFLGFNTNLPYTIGNYGCLITCLGMYVSKLPNEINDLLKANQGFTKDSGDFIWSKSWVLGLAQTYLSPSYYGIPVTSQGFNKMKELLDAGFPLLTEIDFNPVTDSVETHFVLIVGYEGDKFYAADPWTGQVVNLDVYGSAARAIIQFRAYDKKLSSAIQAQPLAQTDQTIIDLGVHGKMEVQRIRGELDEKARLEVKVDSLSSALENLKKLLEIKDRDYQGALTQAGDLKRQLEECRKECAKYASYPQMPTDVLIPDKEVKPLLISLLQWIQNRLKSS